MVEDFQRTLTNALSPLSATGTPSAQTPSEIEVEVLDVRTAKLDVEIDAPHTPSSPEARNRHRMLQNVRTFWIKGVLENSLHGALVLDLGMKQNVGSVVHPWDTLIRMTDSDTQTLPPGTPMIEVFDRLNGKLLILGNPGGGKTTVLLELARDLLDRAARDSEHPIPVVFNLSSWAEKRFPLVEWLIVELNSKYQVPKAVARQWVKEDALLLLLDGLDEVESRYRDACVGAINQYREEHGFVDVVVCSRTADYDALTAKVNLNGAIILQPLNDSQVDAYLASLGKGLTSLRRVLPADPVLQELVRSPLMLNITTLAYHGATPGSLQEVPETRRNHIFAAYVERMFARRAGEKPYTREQTSHYLKWLAQHMIEHGQSVFQIEALQPDWLTPDQFKRYRTIVHTLFVVVFAALFGVTALVNILLIQAAPNWRQPEIGTVPFMILSIVIAALTGGFVGFENAKGLPLRPIARWRQQFAPILLSVLLAFSFSFVVLNSFPAGITLTAIIGGAFGYYIIIQIGMAERRKTGNNPSHIVAAEKIAWNRHKVKPIFLLLSPFLAVVSMFTLRTAFPKPDLAESTFIAAVVIFTLICAGMIVAVVGIVTGNVETHTRPNQGIWQSFIFANRFAAALGGVHLLLVLPISMVASTELALPIALYNLSFLTPSVWLIRGGGPLYHFLLRRVLERDGMIPQNMAHFLDFCAGLILLRKVGGSYIYIHRALLEYFAALPESE